MIRSWKFVLVLAPAQSFSSNTSWTIHYPFTILRSRPKWRLAVSSRRVRISLNRNRKPLQDLKVRLSTNINGDLFKCLSWRWRFRRVLHKMEYHHIPSLNGLNLSIAGNYSWREFWVSKIEYTYITLQFLSRPIFC